MGSGRRAGGLVLCLFFWSGATALVYEVVWSKYLAQMLGSTVQAQTVVLAVFMGGLALGNWWFGRRADQMLKPLRAYGVIEFVIGLYAFFFPSLYAIVDRLFTAVGTGVHDQAWALLLLKCVLSVGLLLGPTLLMGGTLPLMAAWLQRNTADAGRKSARFYSVNSLGAVAGAGLAGFYLVQHWGMVGALQLTALVNLLIGAIAMRFGAAESAPQPSPAVDKEQASIPWVPWTGWLVAITGGVSMGLEVLAARSLVLIFGSSLQSFAIVLMAFILGIGLGSAWVASSKRTAHRTEKWLICFLVGAAVWVGLVVCCIEWWVDVYRVARTGLGRSTTGYVFHQLLTGMLSGVVLGVPAALLGAVVPLLIRHLGEGSEELGRRVGRLLTWNTLGAVTGVLATGFLIMPLFGLRTAFGLLALGLVAVAFVVAWRWPWRPGVLLSGSATTLLLATLMLGGDSWRYVMSSGVFRARETEVDFTVMDRRKEHVKILFYEDAPDATVSVELGDGVGALPELGLRINGKTDASSHADLATQLLLGHLGFLARPESKDVFVLGLGSGITAGAVAVHPIDRLTIAENCAPVIRAARLFDQWNRGVLTNRVTTVRQEDARTVLKLDPQSYDLLITQPSNPWMVGVGSVFSHEYYELAASRLKPGGMMVQWFHLYDMHDGIVSLVLRTFSSVFPHLEIWDSGSGDVILVGSQEPWESTVGSFARVFARPEARADLEGIGLPSPGPLLARQLASQRTAHAIPGPGPLQSDAFPILEYEAPRAFYIGQSSRMLEQFDERTWMTELSSPEKQQTLRELTDPELANVFGRFSTLNEELFKQLSWRLRGEHPDQPGSAPSVFKDATEKPIPEDLSKEVRHVLQAARQLSGSGPDSSAGAAAIEALLRAYNENSDWSVVQYAALAIQSRLSRGDPEQATRILELASALHPQHPRLDFLRRVLEGTGHTEGKRLVKAREL